MNKKLISVEHLRVGMYVVELDRPWLGTPFDFQGFALTSEGQIESLRRYSKSVFIDIEREWQDNRPAQGGQSGDLRGSATYPEVTSVEQELTVAKELYSACEETVRNCIELLRLEAKLDAKPLESAVRRMTRSIERNPDTMMLVKSIKEKGSYELGRAVDSSVLMITFGRFLQLPSERLELLGLAGLLMDIGKVKLPDPLLKKRDLLTAEEYELAKTHVTHSVELIRTASGLPQGLEEIVLMHHERQDGSGYPRALRGSQISIDGAIAGLVDSFSAVTSVRRHAEQMSPSNALSLLFQQKGKLFHEALVEQFIQCIGIYPVGSVVELNTGEIGIVIAQNLVRRLQPRVMVVLDRDWKPTRVQQILDLVKEPRGTPDEPYRIRRTIPKGKLPMDFEELIP